MRVDAPDLANAAGAATPSHYRPHPRYRSAATVVAGAGLLPTVTVNHLNQDASGTLSPPGSRTGLRWLRGGGKTSDCGGFGQCRHRSALGKPRTSRVGASSFFTSPKVTMRGRIRVSRPVCVPSSVAVPSLDTTGTERFPGSDDVDGIVPFDAMARKAPAKTRRCSGEWPRPYPQTPLSDQVERRNEMPVRRKYRIHPLHPTSEAIPPVVATSIKMASDQSLSESHPRHLSAAIAWTYRTAIQELWRYG